MTEIPLTISTTPCKGTRVLLFRCMRTLNLSTLDIASLNAFQSSGLINRHPIETLSPAYPFLLVR